MSLDDKRILVIGGGSGIGFAVAEAAVKAGAQVVVASTNAERTKNAATRLGNRASSATLDIRSEDQVAKFFARSGPFDHIATTAGDWSGSRRAPLAELDLDQAAAQFKVRFCAVAIAARRSAVAKRSLTLTDGRRAPCAKARRSTAMWWRSNI